MCIDSDIALFTNIYHSVWMNVLLNLNSLLAMVKRQIDNPSPGSSFSSCIYMIQATVLLIPLLNVNSMFSSLIGIKHVVDFFSQMPCLIINLKN